MAKTLTEFDFDQPQHQPGREQYPWSEWFDGKIRLLVKGTEKQVEKGDADYHAETSSFKQTVKGAAERYGVNTDKENGNLNMRTHADGLVLQVDGGLS